MSTTTTTTATALNTTLIGMPTDITASEKHRGHEGVLPQGEMAAEEAQRRIKELEAQVQVLKLQNTGSVEKLAEYDEEVRRLRSQASAYTPRTSRSSRSSDDMDKSLSPTQFPAPNGPVQPQPQQQQQQQQQSRFTALTSFFPYGRRPSATPTPPPPPASEPPQTQSHVIPPHPGPDPEETIQLQNALSREQNLRKAAENQLSQAATELEDLTAQLFSQANEMVAQERKARARLEERVAVLERRDVEKRTRLDRLEKAMQRVERLRAMVG
ncbi:uncharacterized protein EURHEDRAFT_376491 [Aspergillus ruber CBS 135680]|uniref:GDP/GTP exchange factor Sec2 N-terminal domain-containing protein n=1 Tax=Aspergillus ruber (strain CBS 135680) TaxID=1388766 RepID=A0A017SHZ5_ASPRC|nr:uncharacterized protein EURHEDRAFT_376491 [Aspergillus ruber CBS 135680]EYE96562.1 hypothetical protein EURHEDRAFT_376491 [Aspergillus ruber CBS 135680]